MNVPITIPKNGIRYLRGKKKEKLYLVTNKRQAKEQKKKIMILGKIKENTNKGSSLPTHNTQKNQRKRKKANKKP